MKKIFIMALLCVMATSLKAQNTNPWPSTGNIGIGTGSGNPSYLLTLSGTNPQLSLFNPTAGNETSIMFNTNVANKADWFLGQNEGNIGTGNFGLYTTMFGQAITVLGNNGNVGIGTTSPGSTLEVAGVVTTKLAHADGIANRIWNTLTGNSLTSYSTGTTAYGIPSWVNAGVIEHDNNLVLDAYAGTISLQTGRSTVLFVKHDGHVGIGTTNPGTALQIGDGTGANIVSVSSNVSQLQLNSTATNGVNWALTSYADGNMYLANLITGTNNVSFAPGGNVGIGTTDNAAWQLANSTYKLAVGGNVLAEEVTVKLRADWPDYVFKPKYALMPLADVKTYIDKNQHLPDMPSAAQVEKDGLNLGEMNKLLLKKVEELTLYLIEKDKNEKEQKDIISDLKKQMTDQKDQLTRLEKQLELVLKKSQ